jgi:hypothetical protein
MWLSMWLRNFVEHHRSPEWIAAFALLIQAGIFGLHAWILHRHGKSLEENVKIAKTQTDAGQLMAKAWEQQGKTLDDQTKIMNEQFKFQRRVTAQADRQQTYDYPPSDGIPAHAVIPQISELRPLKCH